jgi:fibronectin type 3 domain-containing protein
MTGAATHGDIVYGYARTAVDKSAVEVGVARDSNMNVVGERVEAIFNSMDTFVGAFELLVGASTRGDGDRERAGSVAEDEFYTVEREEPAVARAMGAGLDGRGGRAVDMKILHHGAIVSGSTHYERVAKG